MSEEKKGPGGRPSKYTAEMPEKLVEFFNIPEKKKEDGKTVGEEYPMVIDFCLLVGITNSTFFKWCQDHSAFSDAYSHCKKIQEKFLVKNSIQNRYNPYFSQFVLKNNHGWKDKQEVEQTVQEIKIDKQDEKL